MEGRVLARSKTVGNERAESAHQKAHPVRLRPIVSGPDYLRRRLNRFRLLLGVNLWLRSIGHQFGVYHHRLTEVTLDGVGVAVRLPIPGDQLLHLLV
jgi:hypothetical protein